MRKRSQIAQFFLILYLSFLCSCTNIDNGQNINSTLTPQSEGIFIASYGDFGPPQLSNKLIGNKWWQWDDPENHKPVKYDVKVVVYRYKTLESVQLSFPIIPEKKQDYRYLAYEDARRYFDETISKLNKEMAEDDDPENFAMMSTFPLRLYKTALAMERKLRE